MFTDENISNPLYRFGLSRGRHRHGELPRGADERRGLRQGRRARQRHVGASPAALRWEEFQQASLPIDTLQYDVTVGQCALVPCDAAALERIMFEEDDVYPALAMTRIFRDVWAEDFQIRVGLSETVARPDLREISGSSFIDPLTETRIRGNPELVTSAIGNFDLRAEWFFAQRRQLHGVLVLQGHRESDRDGPSRRHRRQHLADVHQCRVGRRSPASRSNG